MQKIFRFVTGVALGAAALMTVTSPASAVPDADPTSTRELAAFSIPELMVWFSSAVAAPPFGVATTVVPTTKERGTSLLKSELDDRPITAEGGGTMDPDG